MKGSENDDYIESPSDLDEDSSEQALSEVSSQTLEPNDSIS